MIFGDQTERFLATAPQMAGTAAVTAALVAAALVAANLFFVRPESWLGVAIGLALVAVMAVLVARWSRRPGWSDPHRLALAAGALSAYAWGGFVLLTLEGAATPFNLAGQIRSSSARPASS